MACAWSENRRKLAANAPRRFIGDHESAVLRIRHLVCSPRLRRRRLDLARRKRIRRQRAIPDLNAFPAIQSGEPAPIGGKFYRVLAIGLPPHTATEPGRSRITTH